MEASSSKEAPVAVPNTQIDSRKFLSVNFMTALLENAMFYPFEFLKTRQQAIDIASSFRPHGSTPVKPERQKISLDYWSYSSSPHLFLSLFSLPNRNLGQQLDLKTQISQTYKTSGPRGFYRGFSWFVMANVPADVIYLYGYAMSKQTLLDTSFGQKFPMVASMISGAAGDFFSIILVVPLEVVAQVRVNPSLSFAVLSSLCQITSVAVTNPGCPDSNAHRGDCVWPLFTLG